MITWESAKEQIFEMPTGGAAIMRKGPNLLKLARKEQCLALTTQLRNKFKLTPCFYRVFPTGEVEYLHPKDGVYPEKVNAGREGANQNMRRIGENVNPIKVCGAAHAHCAVLVRGGRLAASGAKRRLRRWPCLCTQGSPEACPTACRRSHSRLQALTAALPWAPAGHPPHRSSSRVRARLRSN